MNLATARSANRAKEVGVRKTLGDVQVLFQYTVNEVAYHIPELHTLINGVLNYR